MVRNCASRKIFSKEDVRTRICLFLTVFILLCLFGNFWAKGKREEAMSKSQQAKDKRQQARDGMEGDKKLNYHAKDRHHHAEK